MSQHNPLQRGLMNRRGNPSYVNTKNKYVSPQGYTSNPQNQTESTAFPSTFESQKTSGSSFGKMEDFSKPSATEMVKKTSEFPLPGKQANIMRLFMRAPEEFEGKKKPY